MARNTPLIDDVMTTGATVDACARTLKRAGAARVNVLTLAIATGHAVARYVRRPSDLRDAHPTAGSGQILVFHALRRLIHWPYLQYRRRRSPCPPSRSTPQRFAPTATAPNACSTKRQSTSTKSMWRQIRFPRNTSPTIRRPHHSATDLDR